MSNTANAKNTTNVANVTNTRHRDMSDDIREEMNEEMSDKMSEKMNPGTDTSVSEETVEAEKGTETKDSGKKTGESRGKTRDKSAGSFVRGIIVGVAACVTLLTAAAVCIGIMVLRRYPQVIPYEKLTSPDYVPDNSASLDMDKIEDKLELLQEYVSQYFLYDEDMKDVEDGIYRGFVSGLGDKYAAYYNEEDYASLVESTNGTYSGIGALLQQNPDTKIMSVVKVFDGSPAQEAGLQADDIFYKVGDEDITSLDLDVLVSKYIRGEEGTDVTLTVLRGDTHDEVTLTITRRKIEVPTVEYKMLSDGIGYIIVSEYDSITGDQYKKAVDALTQQGMTGLVIDLRDNPGGLVDVSVDMLDYTLPDGMYTYTADKNGEGQRMGGNDGHEISVPIVLLVNDNTASAAEIFAGAMRDYNKAALLGTKTYGKGIVQLVFPLGDGTGLKLTSMHYYTPDGTDLHGEGLAPDIEVEWDGEGKAGVEGRDNQLDAALELLKSDGPGKNSER